MKIKKIIFLTLNFIYTTIVFTQTNLISNYSFENFDKKIKKGKGQFDLISNWNSLNAASPADVFTNSASKNDFGNTFNFMGYQEPSHGQTYVGIRIWEERNAAPFTYIQTKLNSKMIAGKIYCVSFKASLSDLSKYGANKIGAFISSKKISEKNIKDGDVKANIVLQKEPIIKDQYLWKTICGEYTAKGDEKYLTIGGFVENYKLIDKRKNLVRLKLSSQFKGKRQNNDVYFYIDEVEIFSKDEVGTCSCNNENNGTKMKVVHTENVGDFSKKNSPEDIIPHEKIFFEENSVEPISQIEMLYIVEILNQNSDLKIKIIGCSDKLEEINTTINISKQRANAIKMFFVENGIKSNRITTEGRKSSELENNSESKISRAKNRKVIFEIIK